MVLMTVRGSGKKFSPLRRARIMACLRQVDLAKMTGIHYTLISSYEVGRFPVRPHHRRLLAKALAMPESVLFGDEG